VHHVAILIHFLMDSYKVELKLIIWGDINTDYLTDERKKQLDAVTNLTATVYFPTRVQNQSSTAIDNIFIDNYKFTKYIVSPVRTCYAGAPASPACLRSYRPAACLAWPVESSIRFVKSRFTTNKSLFIVVNATCVFTVLVCNSCKELTGVSTNGHEQDSSNHVFHHPALCI
jgi:hypothetical protein